MRFPIVVIEEREYMRSAWREKPGSRRGTQKNRADEPGFVAFFA
jgi:hypothetical protein